MLNHTYTSVKNANLVDCGKKQHIPSQQFPLLRDNFLGEFRTELDKKKVLANLGIVTELSLEWEFIKGDIGKSTALMQELDSRTTYVSKIDGFKKTLIDGIKALEDIIGGELDVETEQDKRITDLESNHMALRTSLEDVQNYISNTVDININQLDEKLQKVTSDLSELSTKLDNITSLIQVSTKENNALQFIEDSETQGLYVPDLSESLNKASEDITQLQEDLAGVNTKLGTFVTKEDLGGEGDYNFVKQTEFDSYTQTTNSELTNIKTDLQNTVKTGEDGHVDTLYVNTISKDNDEGNIKITDSFEVESGIPLDVRFVKEDLEDLCATPVQVCYPGMGVIVNSLSALYILRDPGDGVVLTQDYVSDIRNWKCPEDLVTVALTRQEYENLPKDEINPHVFYYIYEEEIERTSEPLRSEYSSEEEFETAWQQWVNSLKTLSQEYMSASWGVDIENKLSKKASAESINLILEELNNIKGGENSTSLESLSNSVVELQKADTSINTRLDEVLKSSEGEESGRLVDIEKDVTNISESLNQFVTKDYIQDETNDFIFVTKTDYAADQESLKNDLAEQITTKKVISEEVTTDYVTTETINTATLDVGNTRITSDTNHIYANNNPLAELDDIPKMQVLTKTEYDSLNEQSKIDSETYYYTYDDVESLATKEDLKQESARIDDLLLRITQLEDLVKSLTSE